MMYDVDVSLIKSELFVTANIFRVVLGVVDSAENNRHSKYSSLNYLHSYYMKE